MEGIGKQAQEKLNIILKKYQGKGNDLSSDTFLYSSLVFSRFSVYNLICTSPPMEGMSMQQMFHGNVSRKFGTEQIMGKKIVLSEIAFHNLWDMALQSDSLDLYYKEAIRSKTYKSLIESGLNMDKFYILIKQIYSIAKMPISELLDEYSIKNSVLSHRLCIPVKTIEHWKYGERECPAYMKLIIIKAFNISYLPDGFSIESETDLSRNRLRLIKPDSIAIKKSTDRPSAEKRDLTEDRTAESYHGWSLRAYEQSHAYNDNQKAKGVLSATDYLDKIIKRNKSGK